MASNWSIEDSLRSRSRVGSRISGCEAKEATRWGPTRGKEGGVQGKFRKEKEGS